MLAAAEAVEEAWAWGLAVEWASGSVLIPVSGADLRSLWAAYLIRREIDDEREAEPEASEEREPPTSQ